jgi:hypothetical protein
MVNIGDIVIWIDEDLRVIDAKVTKIKRDNLLDLEFPSPDGKLDAMTGELVKTIVTSGSHESVQHPDYGCYWKEKKV